MLNLESGSVDLIKSKVVTLATGGASKVYPYTTYPDGASGDGIAMAWRSQYGIQSIPPHPTCLFHPHAK